MFSGEVSPRHERTKENKTLGEIPGQERHSGKTVPKNIVKMGLSRIFSPANSKISSMLETRKQIRNNLYILTSARWDRSGRGCRLLGKRLPHAGISWRISGSALIFWQDQPLFHHLGQLFAALAMTGTPALLTYLAILGPIGLATGLATGCVAGNIQKRIMGLKFSY